MPRLFSHPEGIVFRQAQASGLGEKFRYNPKQPN